MTQTPPQQSPQELTEDLVSAARSVLRGLKLTPGGDAYEYHGSMNDVNWLREAVEALQNAAFSATKDEEEEE